MMPLFRSMESCYLLQSVVQSVVQSVAGAHINISCTRTSNACDKTCLHFIKWHTQQPLGLGDFS